MEVFSGYYVIIYVLSSFIETESVKQGIDFNKTLVVDNYTQLFRNYSAYSVRYKRDILEVPKIQCCSIQFLRRHIRRGNCNGVWNNAGLIFLRGYKRELAETGRVWPGFTKKGKRYINTFLVHEVANYNGISDILKYAYEHGENFQQTGVASWNFDVRVEFLDQLRVVHLTGIKWTENGKNRWIKEDLEQCVCGRTGITIGYNLQDNVVTIDHFQSLFGDMIVENPNCN